MVAHTPTRLKIDQVEAVIFFGGGTVLTRIVGNLVGKKRVHVVTGERLLAGPSHEPGVFLAKFLQERDVPQLVVDDVNTSSEVFSLITPMTLGISPGAPWIFKREIIEAFGGRLINGHAAPLPQDRGGGGFSWRIMRGSRLGCSVYHVVTTRIDDGSVVKYREYLFPASCRVPRDFETYAADRMYELLEELLAEIDRGQILDLLPQAEHLGSYWPRLNAEIHGFIDWSWSAEEIVAFVTAFDDPYPGASTWLRAQAVRLRNVRVDQSDGTFHPFQAGLVYRKGPPGLFVAARGGGLIVGEVAAASENITARVRIGDRFHTPQAHLERARATRVFYTPRGMRIEES